MAAEAIGKSQKTKNRVATVLMVIFFTILAILIILPIYAIILASFKPGNHLLQYGLNLDLDSARRHFQTTCYCLPVNMTTGFGLETVYS